MKLSTVTAGVLLAAASSVAAKKYIVTYPRGTDMKFVEAKAQGFKDKGATVSHIYCKSPDLLLPLNGGKSGGRKKRKEN